MVEGKRNSENRLRLGQQRLNPKKETSRGGGSCTRYTIP